MPNARDPTTAGSGIDLKTCRRRCRQDGERLAAGCLWKALGRMDRQRPGSALKRNDKGSSSDAKTAA